MISDQFEQPRKEAKSEGRDGARPSQFVLRESWPPCHPILVVLFCAVFQLLCEGVSGQNIRSHGEIYGSTPGADGRSIRSRSENYGSSPGADGQSIRSRSENYGPAPGVEGQNIRSRGEYYGPASGVENTTSMEVLDDKRPLRVGDRLSMRVVEDRKSPTALVVTDSGEVEVPLIGRVMAKGKTCKQLAYSIKGPLERDYYYKATVIIGLDVEGHISPGRVYVTGQVHSQGPIEIPPDETFTVSRAILKAGGFADFANKRKVKLVRKNSSEPIIVDVDTIVRKGRFDKDPAVEPEDTIIVPERLINF
jgi:protein involved in polysaccharide export with SLBB domain